MKFADLLQHQIQEFLDSLKVIYSHWIVELFSKMLKFDHKNRISLIDAEKSIKGNLFIFNNKSFIYN